MAFYIVYIREAHPSDGWQVGKNRREGIVYTQPKNILERAVIARQCVSDLKFELPCLIDDMKNSAMKAYSAWPDRIYVIDKKGKIAMKGAPGPRGFSVEAAEEAIKKLSGE